MLRRLLRSHFWPVNQESGHFRIGGTCFLATTTNKYNRSIVIELFRHAHVDCKSYPSTSKMNPEINVRFAPSPTGLLHLGSVRTAFINYLFARKHNGSLILRIEDTDQTRIVPGAVEKIQETLEWCGIRPDEGPFNGDRFKPYFQSQRIESYQKYAQHLLDEGHAYRCFCNEMTLNLMRKEAVRTRQTPRYDNRCRHLTSNQVNEKLGNNEKHVIRFKLRSGPVDFHDLIMSNVRIDLSETESDFIILKSDGFPTYHLANVIDDHHMQISHVLRGIEWLHSTPKHLMLYDAFGWRAPLFAHLPLILNQGGGKLSKRHEHVNLAALKANGVRPESVLNYLASIGGGFDLELSRNNSKIYSIRELIDAFDVKLIRNIPNKLDSEKLLFFNRLAIQKAVDAESPDLLHELKSLIQDKLNVTPNDDQIRRTAIALRDRVSTVNDMVDEYAFFWTDQISTRLSANIDVELCVLVLDDAAQVFESHDSDHIQPQQFELMKHFCSVNKIKYGKYMQVLRLTLTGKKDGLPISELYELLGKSTVLRKIRYFRSNVLHNSTESNERVNL